MSAKIEIRGDAETLLCINRRGDAVGEQIEAPEAGVYHLVREEDMSVEELTSLFNKVIEVAAHNFGKNLDISTLASPLVRTLRKRLRFGSD